MGSHNGQSIAILIGHFYIMVRHVKYSANIQISKTVLQDSISTQELTPDVVAH